MSQELKDNKIVETTKIETTAKKTKPLKNTADLKVAESFLVSENSENASKNNKKVVAEVVDKKKPEESNKIAAAVVIAKEQEGDNKKKAKKDKNVKKEKNIKNKKKKYNQAFEPKKVEIAEQLIMDGVEPPVIEEDDENLYKYTYGKNGRKIKSARIISKDELWYLPKEKVKKVKRLKIDDVERFNVNSKFGLNDEQIQKRISQGFTNKTENKNVKTYKNIFISNIFTFFNLLYFLIAGALIYVKSFDQLFFMVIILANMFIGIIQEIKAKKTIEKISLVSTPTANVIRNGKVEDISIHEIVLDDIINFSLGKQICADSVIVEGEVEVNESLLTGESVAVKKKKGDLLLSGSFIVSGKCLAKVDKVGNYNYSALLAAKAKQYTKPKSELLYSLRIIIKLIAVLIVPLTILMYNNNLTILGGFQETIEKTAGSVVGMIPAGMFLLTSLALAVGVIKLSKKRTLVQDLYSIEMLARIDVLCLDKTGTITDGTMKVNNVIEVDKTFKGSIDDIVGSMLTALDDNNQTSRALATYFGYSKELTAKTVMPFSSSRKFSAVTFKNKETYIMGAAEFILKTKNESIEKIVKQYASKGLRILLLAKCEGEIIDEKLPLQRKPIAIIVIEDHIREDAEQTIKWFKDNGVQIKIISGDNPITVSEVSKRVGVERAELFISLEGLNEQQVIEAASKYTVFGRVSPEQKLILIKALKTKGHKVAMTGDGVNDILALKEADCSVAMASGSEAARHVSNLVLLDSNFSSMPSVVAEGRRVINNIQKSSSLFLMKTIFTIVITLLCLLLAIPYPFTLKEIILLEVAVIGIPSFFLALQQNSDQIRGKFLPNLLSKALPAAFILIFNVAVIYLFDMFVGTQGQFSSMASIAVTAAGLLVLFRLSKPFDVFRGILMATMVVFCALMVILNPLNFFDYGVLSTQNILLIIVLVQISYPLYNSLIKLINKIQFNSET